jgi:hypothetical protein
MPMGGAKQSKRCPDWLLLFRVDVDQLRLLSSHRFVSDPAIAGLMVKLVTTTQRTTLHFLTGVLGLGHLRMDSLIGHRQSTWTVGVFFKQPEVVRAKHRGAGATEISHGLLVRHGIGGTTF